MTAIFVLCAIVLLVGGYLIRVHRKWSLLAGYDPNRVVDPDGLARLAGFGLYVMGIGTLVVPFLMLVFAGELAAVLIGVGYLVYMLAVVLAMAVAAGRYVK